MIRQVLEALSSREASARTATARVWVPALPPSDEMIGISTASATTLATSSWKMAIALTATVSVTRLISSQGMRERTMPATDASRPASDTLASASMSSSPSSAMTPTTSSTVIWPTSRPPGSTTGAEIRWYLSKM